MRLYRAALLLPACLLATGCVATQQDMLQMQSQMDDLNNSLSSMQKNQAELAVKMEDLSKNLNVSSENMKDISGQMTRLSAKLDDLDNAMNKRVNAIGQTIKKQQEETVQTIKKQQQEVETALLPAKMYNDAYNAFLNNNFDGAASGFKSYLAKYPSDEMAESAYFYMGESLYLRERWQEAAVAYASVLEKHPKSPRVPACRLKYALALLRLGEDKKPEAMKYLHSVTRDFPDSPEADTARDHIARLSPKPAAPAKPAAKPAAKAPAKKTP